MLGGRCRPWILIVAGLACGLVLFAPTAAVPLAVACSVTLGLRRAGAWNQVAGASALIPLTLALPVAQGIVPLAAGTGLVLGLIIGLAAAGPVRPTAKRRNIWPVPTWLLTLAGGCGVSVLVWTAPAPAWPLTGLAVGAVLAMNEAGVWRRTAAALGAAALIDHLLGGDHQGVLVALVVPGLRTMQIPVYLVLPGMLLAQPLAQSLVTGAAVLVAGWTWDVLPQVVRPAWRALPPSWRCFTWGKLQWDPVYRLLIADVRPWGRVLDLGCGTGLGALVVHQRGADASWSGIDLDARKVAIAELLLRQLPGTETWTTRIDRLPLTEAVPADTILALDILHYWPWSEQENLVRWMRSCLQPGGIVWLREGTSEGAGAALVSAGERFTTAIGLNPSSELFFRSATAWEELFRGSGFAVAPGLPCGASNRLWRLEATAHADRA